jgi:diguanylate cyclase (GGDEF)-like protein/putative nucleotidyltransferase with HDIG domain
MKNSLNLPSSADIKKVLRHDNRKLPSFPPAAAKLIEISRNDKASLADLAKIVETDPGISVRVLEIVNSAMYGLKRKITALSEAVVFVGQDEIKKIALGMTIFEKMFKPGASGKFNRILFWRHCISVAVLSMEIAGRTGYPEPEGAYIAGLLHDIGKIILDTGGKTDYEDFLLHLSGTADLLIEKERSIIGLGHDDVGAFFCTLWKLPRELALAVKYHHQPFDHLNISPEHKQLISIVSLADFLCWAQGIGSFDLPCPPVLPPEVEKIIQPDKINLGECMAITNKEIEAISKFYHFVFPSATELKENMLWANIKLSRANTKYYYHHDTMGQLSQGTGRNSNITHDLALELGKPLAKAGTIKEVLDIVMYQVGQIFEPLHWSILLKDPKTSDMVFCVVVGAAKNKLQGAKLPKGEGIAGYIMETGKSLIVEDVSRDSRFSAKVDKYTGFKTRSVIGTPLKTDKKIFGVIELINRIDDRAFTDHDLKILASIGEYAAIAIERSYYQQALKNIATKDSLTGLKNRWSFERAVSGKDDVLKRYGSIFSMLIIEADLSWQLKETKDRSACDKSLKALAKVLASTKRREDDIFRYGEEVFIMLLPLTYSDGAQMAKHRILKAFSDSVDETSQCLVRINIQAHTVSAEDSGQLKSLVAQSLSRSKTISNDDKIADMTESLQPLLEKEAKSEPKEIQDRYAALKTVSLAGEFIRLKTRESGHIRVEKLSMLSIGFRISKSHRIQVNDFLDIHFILDDIKKSLVKRRIVVREIKGNFINADFYNPPPYAKKLGFYLMN